MLKGEASLPEIALMTETRILQPLWNVSWEDGVYTLHSHTRMEGMLLKAAVLRMAVIFLFI